MTDEKISKKEEVSYGVNDYKRPSWDEYFMQICDVVKDRSTCDRGRGGAVIVKDKQILTTGYIGSPRGLPHCDDVGHQIKKVVHEDSDGHESQHCVRTLHSEMNAILQAAKLGIPLDGATLYTFKAPCRTCAMAIINAGIKRVVSKFRYHADDEGGQMFKQAGVQFEILNDEIVQYEKQ